MPQGPRDVLRSLVDRHGAGLAEDPRRCGSLLRDHLRTEEHGREVHVLVAAAQMGVPADLRASPDPLTAQKLAARLTQAHGTREDLARWAVEAWAHALGLPLPATPARAAPQPQQAELPTPGPEPRPQTKSDDAQDEGPWGFFAALFGAAAGSFAGKEMATLVCFMVAERDGEEWAGGTIRTTALAKSLETIQPGAMVGGTVGFLVTIAALQRLGWLSPILGIAAAAVAGGGVGWVMGR